MIKIVKNENIKFDSDGIHLISKKASGSLRDALSLLDQVIAYTSEGLDIETIRDVLGIIKENIFLDIIKSIEQRDNQEVINQLNKIIDAGYAISDFICGFNEYLRNCMLQKTGYSQKIKISENSASGMNICRFSTLDFLRMLDLSLQFERDHFLPFSPLFIPFDSNQCLSILLLFLPLPASLFLYIDYKQCFGEIGADL